MIPHLYPVFLTAVVAPPVAAGRIEARGGILISGITHAGLAKYRFQVLIGGVDCTAFVRYEDTPTITETLDGGAPSFAFSLYGMTPTLGSDVIVRQAAPNDYLFGGTLTTRQPRIFGVAPGKLHWHCLATGYAAWLMDRYALVTKRYATRGINTVVHDLITTYTDGGFRVGFCPSSLGDIAIDFDMTSVRDAILRCLAASDTEAYLEVTPERIVNCFDTYPAGPMPTITEDTVDLSTVEYQETIDEIRTRAIARGDGSLCSATVGPGSTTIPLEDVSRFSAAGGEAISQFSIFNYTGKSVESGPGDLVGVTGLDYDVFEGDPVELLFTSTDAGKVATLAAALGGGLSGIASHYVDVRGGATVATVQDRAEMDVSKHGDAAKVLAFRYADTPRNMGVGRIFAASVTRPLAITGSYRVQVLTTTIQALGRKAQNQDIRSPSVLVRRHVSASKTVRSLAEVLRKVS